MPKSKESISDKILYYAIYGILRAFAHLPLRILYLFSDFLYFAVYKIGGYRKKLVRQNLMRCFPDLSQEERDAIMKQFYHHFADVVVETIKLLHISDEEIDRRVKVENACLINESARKGKSSVLFLGHYGNWEWVTAITRHFSEKQIFAQIYAPLHNHAIDRIMLKIRSRFGSESIPKEKAVRRLFEIEKEGQHFVTGFISDQRPIGKTLHHWTEFLGQDTPYMIGGEAIGDHVGADFFYVDIDKTSRGHYTLRFIPLAPDPEDSGENPVTRQFMKMLEKNIRRAPQYWLWSHNRWKRKRPQNLS